MAAFLVYDQSISHTINHIVSAVKRVEFELPQPERPERIRDETIPKYAQSEDETAPSASEDEIPEEEIKPPEFTELLHPITARDGEKIILVVRFRGFPTPRIRWYHNGREIQSSADFHIVIDYNRGISSLTIGEVFPEDEGEYTCTARSKHGETSLPVDSLSSVSTCIVNLL